MRSTGIHVWRHDAIPALERELHDGVEALDIRLLVNGKVDHARLDQP